MVLMSLLVVLDLEFKEFLVLASLFLELVLGGLCSAKDPQAPKGGLRRGKGGRIAFLLPHFPLLENPPPFDPPRRIIPLHDVRKITRGFAVRSPARI